MVARILKLLAVLRYYGGATLVWVLRPRSLVIIICACVIVVLSYHYVGLPFFILLYKKVLEESARAMGLVERELLLMAPTVSTLFAKLTAKAWAKRVVVVVGGWMLTRRIKLWLVELRVIVFAIIRHQLLQKPLHWWQEKTATEQAIVTGLVISAAVSFVGLHVLGLLVIITFDVMRTFWRALLGPVLWVGTRIAGSKVAEWFHFRIIPIFVRLLLASCGKLPVVVALRRRYVRGVWRILRIIVPIRVKVRAQARELVDEHFARIATRRATRRAAREQEESGG